MKKNIININNIEWTQSDHGDFSHERKSLTQAVTCEKLGASIYRLAPGKKAFPYHYHYANEETVFILEGSGTMRLNNAVIAIKKDDYIAMPTGTEHAHQIINTSEKPLIFLCFSTMIHPDVTEYPDSKKIGVTTGSAPGSDPKNYSLKVFLKKSDAVDYFLDEK
ncbi:MAG TPA: cupin domain-containing protein [Coxiellaceae bacterium]|nr:MAG: hypothetical protein A3E81_01240 [Gammaproteobacteria bacterium RIFCSPHIGHO2_12_FULL_36_30]HLB56785.1 cupin domain-containing protein [Coxiellaceae bacterium]